MMKQILLTTVCVTLCSITVAGLVSCSSAPDFKPSKAIEKASSVDDALQICGEYRIQGDEDSLTMAVPAPASSLQPWIRCFEDLFLKFNEAKDREELVMFFRALQSRYSGASSPGASVIDWKTTNTAVAVGIWHLRKDGAQPAPLMSYAPEDRSAIEAALPDFAAYLSKFGKPRKAKGQKSVGSASIDEKFMLKGDQGMKEVKSLRVPPGERLTAAHRSYCHMYKEYRKLAMSAGDLRDYKNVLEEGGGAGSANENDAANLKRVREKLDKIEGEALARKAALNGDYEKLLKDSPWFQNSHCLQ